MYESLNNSSSTGTVSTDVNGVTRYAINVATDFNTLSYGVGREHNHITVEYQLTNYSGTGTLTMQHSRDGVVWFDMINASGSIVALSITSSVTSGYFVVDNYPLGHHRMKWTAGSGGSATSGTIQILLEL